MESESASSLRRWLRLSASGADHGRLHCGWRNHVVVPCTDEVSDGAHAIHVHLDDAVRDGRPATTQRGLSLSADSRTTATTVGWNGERCTLNNANLGWIKAAVGSRRSGCTCCPRGSRRPSRSAQTA
jgi:hypothetical protein